MAHAITDVGKDWFTTRSVDGSYNENIDIIAVGTGNDSVKKSDTQLANEQYRQSKSSGNVTIEATSNTGEIRCTISITGGTEVTAGSDVVEFGLFSSDGTLIYREVRGNAVTIDSGDNKVFEFKVTVTE